ncbi:ricin B-like lectin R40C1 [Asparagus officinalis]|uniref:ricin B-like lectin R40C1 n=1 Tax=Asparagus officinalis TaxID=4686 RepID=UPI00098E4DE2|nr:ricin B-like lectin R40C1 [Asparagus officinalis]
MSLFGHHHHHHNQDAPAAVPPQHHPVRIYTKAAENYSLTIRNGEVVLAPANPRDEYQHWIKELRTSTTVKDEEGFPSFALVNKATGQAIKHSVGAHNPVRLVPYNPDYLDESVLWSESKDLGDGFRCIRMVNNIRLNFDAFHGDEDHGGVHDGTPVHLYEWFKGKNQRWKIAPYGNEIAGNMPPTRNPTVRVYTKAAEDYSLTVRNGDVVLAPANARDEYQHWYKDMRYGNTVKDEEGFPGFALINKVTGQALKHSLGAHQPVRLVPYNPDYLDESVLWSESKDLGDGFRCIRMVNNIRLNLDAFHGDEDHGGVQDGTPIHLYEFFKKGKNQRWKIVPYY